MKRAYMIGQGSPIRRLIPVVVLICLLPLTAFAVVWNFSVPATEIQPENGVFSFPVSSFADGKAKYFNYKQSPSQWIRFFVVKSSDNVIRAAFDACDVCYRAKKGYVQEGDNMVCVNCGMKFKTTKVNEVTGGCNPAALKRTIKDDRVLITLQDVESGVKYFQ
jgi:uncharacterized membrane protein